MTFFDFYNNIDITKITFSRGLAPFYIGNKMKTKYYEYSAMGGIQKINVDVVGCDVVIYPVYENKITIIKTRRCHLKISQNGEEAKIKQTKKPRFRKSKVEICVPAQVLFNLNVNNECGSVDIGDGAFKSLDLRGGDVSLSLSHASFENVDIACKKLAFTATETKVSNGLRASATDGAAVLSKCASGNLDISFESGSLGFVDLKCKDTSVFTEHGSINAIFTGDKADYTFKLNAKNGLCNMENSGEGANVVKAYSGCGNIIVDFSEPQTEEKKAQTAAA